jgi:hypothetical protein
MYVRFDREGGISGQTSSSTEAPPVFFVEWAERETGTAPFLKPYGTHSRDGELREWLVGLVSCLFSC